MADFRRWLYAFAVVALLAGLTIPASAQTTLMSCTGSANNPLIRAEEYTAMSGDVFITCTGGVPTAIGSLIPKVNITVFVNTPITSKITDTNNPAFNETLLIVDEAGSVGSNNQILNCGNTAAGAPYGTTPFTCDTIAPPLGTSAYNGLAGHPNVFQARQVNNSGGQAIQFIGVPIDPPGQGNGITAPNRTLRITNLRVNAVAFNVTLSQGFSLTTINTTVSFNGTNFGGQQVLNVPNGTVRVGLVTTAGEGSDPLEAGFATFLQCNAVAGATSTSILLTEGFPTAFKVRNWAQIQTNGNPPSISGGDWTWNGGTAWSATDLTQNVPNALYNTESGIMFPASVADPTPNPPTGASSGTWPGGVAFSNVNGISQSGTASQGTRFAIRFSNIPAGSNPSVPLVVDLDSSGVNTGVMILVCGANSAGAGGTPGSCTSTGAVSGTSLLSLDSTGAGMVVYEVVFSNPSALEEANVNVYVNPTVDLNANPPVGGTPEVGKTGNAVASFAPFYATSVTGVGQAEVMNTTFPIPRFRQDFNPTTPISLYSYSKCACDLLFPWVVGDSTFTTSIVVSNTSLDPCAGVSCSAGFTAKPQTGHVTFWFFGTNDVTFNPSNFGTASGSSTITPPQTSSVSVPAGSYLAFVISPSASIGGGQTASNGLKPIAGNFAGYVIAQSEFQYCHGIASISAPAPFSPQTYLGLVLDKARSSRRGGFGNNGSSSFFGSTQVQLQRTLQDFADELEN